MVAVTKSFEGGPIKSRVAAFPNVLGMTNGRALAEVEVGRGEEDLRCKSLFIVCQRRRGLSEDEETRLE